MAHLSTGTLQIPRRRRAVSKVTIVTSFTHCLPIYNYVGNEPSPFAGPDPYFRSTAISQGQELILDNDYIIAKFNQQGHLVSLYDKYERRELIPEGQAGNLLKLYEDVPLYWEAWDVEIYHLNTGKSAGPGKARIGEVGPLRATIIVEHKLTNHSTASQTIVLTAASRRLEFHMEADWHESRKLLVCNASIPMRILLPLLGHAF
jgi:alpha-mannosidase